MIHSSSISRAWRKTALALAIGLSVATPAAAQRPTDAVAVAARQRDAGDLRGAAATLRAHLAAHPDDGTAARQLGQLLYWLHDVPGARAAYEAALARHPEDRDLRIQYGEMLVEIGDTERAHAVLDPLLTGPARGRAALVLGRLAWWSGDLTSARDMFTIARDAGAGQEASSSLQSIERSIAPWLRVSALARHDDQPLDRTSARGEFGFHVSPLAQITLGAERMRHASADSLSMNTTAIDAGISTFIPDARLELDARIGALQRSRGTSSSDVTGLVAAGLRLPNHFVARLRAERAPYLYTTSSLRTTVMTNTITGLVDFGEVKGWLGQAAVQREQYPDANAVSTAYAWLLAPLARAASGSLQAGYGFSIQDATASRFVAATGSGGAVGSTVRGYYSPYYTPLAFLTHSLLVAATTKAGERGTFRLGGSYGVIASEDAPGFVIAQGSGGGRTSQGTLTRRDFHPWTARTSFETQASSALRILLAADAQHTAFYSSTGASVALTWTLGRRAGEAR